MNAHDKLKELARQVVETNPNIEECVDTVIAQLGETTQELLRAVVRVAVQAAVYAARARQRVAAATRPAITIVEQQATSGIFKRTLLDSWYVGNKRLGDCTASELTFEAVQLGAQATGLQRKVEFYTQLAKRVGQSQVRSVLTEEQVASLYDNIAKLTEPCAA